MQAEVNNFSEAEPVAGDVTGFAYSLQIVTIIDKIVVK